MPSRVVVLGGMAVRKKDGYTDFVNRTFQEIDDLESESKGHPLVNALREYGLTLQEAALRYYKRGMTSNELLEAVKADHEDK
jgi:hypothetical protein